MELIVGLIVLAALLAGYFIGGRVQHALPATHLSGDSKDVVKAGVGAIITLTGLVLGLLVASTKGSFDTKSSEIQQFSSSLIELDRSLLHYGPDADAARAALKRYTALKLETTWPDQNGLSDEDGAKLERTKGVAELENIGNTLRSLKPATPNQSAVLSRSFDLYYRITDARWSMAAQSGSTVQPVFLILLIFWLTVMFASFGLFGSQNGTAAFFMLLCAISFSAALYIVLEMDTPFGGIVSISDAPMRTALAEMGH